VLPGQICRDPLRATPPIPWSIEAWEAFADDQASVVHWPCMMAAGVAESDTVGAGGGGGAALIGQSAFAMFAA
jgi:hypothetical protein